MCLALSPPERVDSQALTPPGGPVRADLADGVLTLTSARPDRRNALDDEMQAALREAFERAATEHAVRGVILTGEGRTFSAGAICRASSVTGIRAISATTAIG